MRLWLIILLSTFTAANIPKSKQILCSRKFPDFVTCIKEHAHIVFTEALDECKEKFSNGSTYLEFGGKACNDDELREKFINCIKEIKKNKDFCGKIPKKCYDEVNVEKKDPQKGTPILAYFCDLKKRDKRERPERFCCLMKKAPRKDVEAMRKCQEKHIPLGKNEKFITKICNPKNIKEMVIKLGEWKDCYMEAIGKNSTNCSPSYISECSKATEPCRKRS
ncbi:uncharacterized protein LOC111639450 [Centruroides sculpturatus]|uniref:uncharacterized protein LOC111639450 n=1 Tax=Centruroides sculpturatus TaxID=218467 RepID=UPI000C6EEF23|nr:uncharacterized protein LOC111639450 [Centruroides sculpturatus]